jgi:transposase
VHGASPASGVHPLPQQDQPRDPGPAGVAPDRRQLRHPQAPQEPAPAKAGVRAWLERHKRFHFHFTPTSASWLNAVEGFFAKLTRQRLKRGVFKGIVDLQAAINRYLDETNDNPKPFIWTADPDAIIEKVRRGKQVLESIH